MAKAKSATVEATGSLPPGTMGAAPPAIAIPPLDFEAPVGYVQRHIDLQLTEPQGLAARRLFDALDRDGARLIDGRRPKNVGDAIRWLLEQVPPA